MNEIDELARVLLSEADAWFANKFHLKLQRLIQIAREGALAKLNLAELEKTLEQEREMLMGAKHE